LVTYFERPICRLAEDFGIAKAVAGQRDVDAAWGLLDLILGESEFAEPVPRFVGHMGMFTLNHLMVHLQNNLLRKRGGLVREQIRISRDAPFVADMPAEFAGLYELVPQDRVQALLETDDPRYLAVLSNRKGCMNSALICEHLIHYLAASYGSRFQCYEHSPVVRVELVGGKARALTPEGQLQSHRLVLCTNGFTGVELANAGGPDIALPVMVEGTIGYMAGMLADGGCKPGANSYLMSPRIGEGQAYFYTTRRPFPREGRPHTLTCIGGPDSPQPRDQDYDRQAPYPAAALNKLNAHIAPVMGWPEGHTPRYDYLWHGLMGYTPNQVRMIGPEPRNATLLYNLGCNGVGLLPAIHGAWRVSQVIQGARIEPSMFDPA
jgi:glycine/D-amino acid oxidase-like deaminating enzyme